VKSKQLALGLDLATSTGFAVIDGEENLVDCGILDLGKGAPHPVRFLTLYKELKRLVKEHQPSIVVVEELHCGRNVNSTKLLGGFLAVVVVALPRKIAFHTCHQSTAKSQVVREETGISQPTKEDVFDWAKDRYSLVDYTFKKHSDVTDAILVALWGIRKLTNNSG
jgi:Holliday junction resolvasome RuvABC endonuclease subunit